MFESNFDPKIESEFVLRNWRRVSLGPGNSTYFVYNVQQCVVSECTLRSLLWCTVHSVHLFTQIWV